MPRSGTEDVSKLLNEFVERLEGTRDPGHPVSAALNCCISQLEPCMADGRVSFVTIHYRNPALEEGRLSRLAVGKTARERTIASLGEILEDSSNITNLVSRFHDRLLDVYFGLIGRSDSFSDAVLRAFAERPPRVSGDEADDRSRIYSFAFLREAAPLPLTCEASNGKFCIRVSKELQFRLLGWDGRPSIDQAKSSDCQLLHPLYRIVWDSVINQQQEANDDKRSFKQFSGVLATN
ncbi:MAG: hypothetical protein ACRD2L_17790 [Terriglobia bacterium]